MNTRSFLYALLALFPAGFLTSCLEPPPGTESDVWRRPARYGAGGTATRGQPPGQPPGQVPGGSRPPGGSRYGYSGAPDTPPPGPVGPAVGGSTVTRERDRDTGVAASGDRRDEKPPVERPAQDRKPSGPPAANEMPFAKGVPGKPLFVIVPGRGNLGEISIEQYDANNQPTGKPLPPGTPVEIPDPGNPGQRIYFRVP